MSDSFDRRDFQKAKRDLRSYLDHLERGDPDEDASLADEAFRTSLAEALGYRVQEPSNLPYTSMTKKPGADVYRNSRDFVELPHYCEDLDAAMKAAPQGWDLELVQYGTKWTASYVERTGARRFSHSSDEAALSVIVAVVFAWCGSDVWPEREGLAIGEDAPDGLSGDAERLLRYALEFRVAHPDARPAEWMGLALERLASEHGHDRRRFAEAAQRELAARFVFG